MHDVFPRVALGDEDQCLRRALAGEGLTTVGRRYPSPTSGRRASRRVLLAHYATSTARSIGAFAVIRDNTHRSISDQRLGETENRFRNMADAAPVLLWMAEPDGSARSSTKAWLDFTGRTLEKSGA